METGGMQPGVRPARCAFSASPVRRRCSTCSRMRNPLNSSPVFSLPGTCNAVRASQGASRAPVVVGGDDVSGVAACMCPAASPALPSVASVASERERRGHLSPLARTGDRTRAQAARRHGGTAARRHARARAERRALRLAAQRISRAGGAAVQPNPNPHSVLGERGSAREMERRPHAILHALDW